LPDSNGVEATRQIRELLQGLTPNDVVLCLISGGGSALWPAPAEGISLEEKQEVTALLLRAGANIQELNAVRKHLSALKGGQLARWAFPASVISLIMSDVIGDPLDSIASGPTTPDPTTFADALVQHGTDADDHLMESDGGRRSNQADQNGDHDEKRIFAQPELTQSALQEHSKSRCGSGGVTEDLTDDHRAGKNTGDDAIVKPCGRGGIVLQSHTLNE
jgi:glycerate-2-kinase